MSDTIYRYPLRRLGYQEIDAIKGDILAVDFGGEDGSELCVWIDGLAGTRELRRFCVHEDGHTQYERHELISHRRFLGTAVLRTHDEMVLPTYVLHTWEC